jgi:subtilisin family serine protease
MRIKTKLLIAVLMPIFLNASCGGSTNSSDSTPSSNTADKADTSNTADTNDPLTPYQWHLKNVGQTAFSKIAGVPGIDLDVMPAYDTGLSGNGVKVMVVDSGTEIEHEDLAANIIHSMLHNFGADAANADDPTPTSSTLTDAHGTAVAGIIGAVSGNGIGGQGVAPRVALGAMRMIGCGDACASPSATMDAFGAAPYSSGTDVFNGSFGAAPTAPLSFDVYTNYTAVVMAHLETLRGGKGAINLQAAGNEYLANNGDATICARAKAAGVSCSNASFDPQRALPQTIVVGAVNASGVRASYSTAGSALLISGLGGEFGNGSGPAIITTDLTGCSRGMDQRQSDPSLYANDFENPDSAIGKALNPDCKYTSVMNGTSSATPTVSGVVALMLEANPNLTWRDVRTILMKTARRIDASRVASAVPLTTGELYVSEPAWTRNAAGLWFDHWYGFGLVDAAAAVSMARNYTSYLTGPMLLAEFGSTPSEGEKLVTTQGALLPANFSGPAIQSVEAMQLVVSLGDASMGNIGIEVISPSGTRSVLQQPFNAFSTTPSDVQNLVLASNAFNGESAQGTWKIRVIDVGSGGSKDATKLTSATLRVFGH